MAAGFLAAVACKPTTTPTEVGVAEAVAASPEEASWTVVLRPPRGVDSPVSGVLRFDALYSVSEGGTRVLHTAQGFQHSRDFSVLPLIGAAVGEAGALWTTLGGLVYRTPDVVGPLTPVERLNAKSVAVVGEHGFACTVDGELVRFSMADVPRPRSLGVRCEALQAREGSLFVRRSKDDWRRSTDAGEHFEPSSAPPPEALTLDRYARRPSFDADPWAPLDALAGFWRLEERLYDVTGRAVEFRGRAGKTQTRDPEGLSCAVRSTAVGPVATCSAVHEDALPALRVYDWDGDWAERAVFPSTRRGPGWLDTVTDAVAGGVAFPGACDRERFENTGEVGICWVPAGAEPRTRTWVVGLSDIECAYDEETCALMLEEAWSLELTLVQVEAPYLIYRLGDRSAPGRLVDLRTGDAEALPPCDSPRLVGWGHLQCNDGEDGVSLWALGDAKPQAVELPEGAVSVAFASWTRGLAAGRRADAVWSTTDGGQTWEPLTVELTGPGASLPLGRARCTNAACVAAPVLWVDPELLSQVDVEPVEFVGFEQSVDLSGVAKSDWGRW